MLTPSRTPLKKKTLLDVVFFARASERHYSNILSFDLRLAIMTSSALGSTQKYRSMS